MINPEASEYRIEDGIPIPEQLVNRRSIVETLRRDKYPWSSMKIDQSFLVPCPTGDVERLMNSLTSCRAHAEKKLGWRFALRRTAKGIRVWRMA